MDDFEHKILREKILREHFDGDQARMDRDDEKTLHEVLYFDKIIEAVEILPELEFQGKQAIKAMLGFLPDDFITIPHEPYIRGIVNSFKMGMLTEQQFYDAVEDSVIPMRNKFVFDHNEVVYPQSTYERYNNLLEHQKSAATNRITKLLGYEPNIGASISTIVSLANTMFQDAKMFPEHVTPADYQVIQIIKYREVLLGKGKDAANKSSLPRLTDLNLEAFPPKAV